VARSFDSKKSRKKASDQVNAPLSLAALNQNHDTQFVYPPPLVPATMSTISPPTRHKDPPYHKRYAVPQKHCLRFQYNSPNFSQAVVVPPSIESMAGSANFLPPPDFDSRTKVPSDYTFLIEERARPLPNTRTTLRAQSLKLARSPKPLYHLSYAAPPADTDLTFDNSKPSHRSTVSPAKHPFISTETLVPLSRHPSSPTYSKTKPPTQFTPTQAKYMVTLSLSIRELARLVAPSDAFKMPPVRRLSPSPSKPRAVKIRPPLAPRFLSCEVMLWENYIRQVSLAAANLSQACN
ncbi:hypothetical protein L0F63_007153, partial [Massospora cicadina]